MNNTKLANALLFMRLSVALVLLMWTIDKFINVGHATAVFEKFYFIAGLGESIMMAIAIGELILIGLFVIGRFKNITYLIVLIIHAVSTLAPFAKYLDPYNGNLLFFTAWPMLAACYALYALREYDTKLNF
ncbi:hypothetical protein [Arenicella xantha]|uniref:DoxX-like protein n=1 Tax=Arenicella xantha TaxID=644221 RepID=A0A395JK84_9GAMM|nr:hypothetical protein [Arenicella xantha]RBP49312.1 hypothetical protein DFR28_104241 [Arenicella xantha]